MLNKKVLLRKRKRHTARRVVSTPSVVLPGYPPPPPRGGPGTPPGGYLTQVPPRGTWPGYPRGGSGYPPLPHGILGNVAKHYGIWVPPPVDRQIDGWTDACQNITFPRTTYAGGNKGSVFFKQYVLYFMSKVLHVCGTFAKIAATYLPPYNQWRQICEHALWLPFWNQFSREFSELVVI